MAYNVALLQPSSLRGAPHVTRAAPACRGAFFGGCQRLRAARPQQRRRTALSAQAFQAEWPDPEFIKETKAAFPEKGVATVEEARVRCSGHWQLPFATHGQRQPCSQRAVAAATCSMPTQDTAAHVVVSYNVLEADCIQPGTLSRMPFCEE